MGAAMHTPGPWKVVEWTARDSDGAVKGGGNQVVDASGHMISACTVEGSSDTEESDVRLIASSPDLLAVLVTILQQIKTSSYVFKDSEELRTARAAIAKATGSAA